MLSQLEYYEQPQAKIKFIMLDPPSPLIYQDIFNQDEEKILGEYIKQLLQNLMVDQEKYNQIFANRSVYDSIPNFVRNTIFETYNYLFLDA